MSEPTLWDQLEADRGEPYAEVERVGRWTYRISVKHHICVWGPDGYGWHRIGRERAGRKARKVLAQYRREMGRKADVTVVTDA